MCVFVCVSERPKRVGVAIRDRVLESWIAVCIVQHTYIHAEE